MAQFLQIIVYPSIKPLAVVIGGDWFEFSVMSVSHVFMILELT